LQSHYTTTPLLRQDSQDFPTSPATLSRLTHSSASNSTFFSNYPPLNCVMLRQTVTQHRQRRCRHTGECYRRTPHRYYDKFMREVSVPHYKQHAWDRPQATGADARVQQGLTCPCGSDSCSTSHVFLLPLSITFEQEHVPVAQKPTSYFNQMTTKSRTMTACDNRNLGKLALQHLSIAVASS
jgi:hypothetical protein